MLISFVSRDNFLKRFNPAEEPFDGTALLVKYRIEPERPFSSLSPPRSPVDRDIALDPSFPVVLTNLAGIVGRICGDDRRMILGIGNLKCFESWLVEPGIMGICLCNRAGKREAVSIDQNTQLVPLYLFIAIIAGRPPFLAWISLVSVAQCERSIFLIS